MIERSSTTRGTTVATETNDEYLARLGDKRTARHASEENYDAPSEADVIQSTRIIRNDVTQPFAHYKIEGGLEVDHETTLDDVKTHYWERASRVTPEYGANYGPSLEGYLRVGAGRSYEDIKKDVEERYPEESVPRSVLDSIDAYHEALGINPALAASITSEFIGRRLGDIKFLADSLKTEDGLSNQEADAQAFRDFVNSEVPRHITTILEKHGQGDEAIRPYANKMSFYPEAENDNQDTVLVLSTEDAKGLIEVYGIQNRPYSDEQLKVGNELAHLKPMQAAMIRTQEEMVEVCDQYLKDHPERATGNLKNYSEIFVPQSNGGERELLPNPKLIRAMVNNVMPAIATALEQRDATINQLTPEDIDAGVKIAAKEHKLFQASIGKFKNANLREDTVELHSFYKVVCPANSLFPNFLTQKLSKYYEASQNIQ